MAISLQWITHWAPSCFHAAAALARGESLADGAIEAALSAPIVALTDLAAAQRLDLELLLAHLTPPSSTVYDNLKLARAALEKSGGDCADADSLSHAIGALKAGFLRAKPQAAEELALREGPLREQWEARGPGLLARLARLVGEDCIARQADVLLVHPIQGGGGSVHEPYNSVCFEAVLANPYPDLPEVVRLGWLIAQLGLQRTLGAGEAGGRRQDSLARLALLPAVLTAAEEVELVRPAESIELCLTRTMKLWRVDGIEPGALARWWRDYLGARPPWSAAISSLGNSHG